MADANALFALDALAVLVAIVDDQRVAVAEHSLQISVGTDGGAETLAKEKKVEQGKKSSGGTGDATGGFDIKESRRWSRSFGSTK